MQDQEFKTGCFSIDLKKALSLVVDFLFVIELLHLSQIIFSLTREKLFLDFLLTYQT